MHRLITSVTFITIFYSNVYSFMMNRATWIGTEITMNPILTLFDANNENKLCISYMCDVRKFHASVLYFIQYIYCQKLQMANLVYSKNGEIALQEYTFHDCMHQYFQPTLTFMLRLDYTILNLVWNQTAGLRWRALKLQEPMEEDPESSRQKHQLSLHKTLRSSLRKLPP